MMKLLILSVGLFAVAVHAGFDVDVPDVLMSDYEQIPINDPVLIRTIKAQKVEIVLKVNQEYPNVTDTPQIKINSAEKKAKIDLSFPPIYKFRANITLFAKVVAGTVPGSFPPIPLPAIKPIITFNVSIVLTSYGGEYNNQYSKLRIRGLPGISDKPEPEANQGRDFGRLSPVPWNDTGRRTVLAAVQKYTILKIKEQVAINGTISGRKNFAVTKAMFRAPKESGFPIFDFQYYFEISLILTYKPILNFSLIVLTRFTPDNVRFVPVKFLAFKSAKDGENRPLPPPPPKQTLPDLHTVHKQVIELKDAVNGLTGVITDLKKKPEVAEEETDLVDYDDFYRLVGKFRKTIISTVNFLQHFEEKELVVVPQDAQISPGKVEQKTVILPIYINPPYYNRTYIATSVELVTIDPYKVYAANITLELSELRRNETESGPLVISQETLVRVNDHYLPQKVKLPVKEEEPKKVEEKPTPRLADGEELL